MVHPRLSVDQLCFPGATVGQFVQQCRSVGVEHVVLASPSLLADGGLETAQEALVDGPAVEAINHPFAIHPDLDRDEGGAEDSLARLIPIAAELGARSIYLVTGGRGRLSWEEAAARFSELVAPGAAAARERGMRVLIENTNGLYADIHIAHTLADTLMLAERADLGVCIELQFCWAEASLSELFRRAMPRCGLVQVSDYVLGDRWVPGRAVPGDGVVPLQRIVGDLLDAGYQGRFDIEVLGPRIDQEGHLAAVTRSVEHMDELLTAVDPESA